MSEELEFGGKKLGLDCQAGLAQALKNFLQMSTVLPELIKISSRYTNTKSKSPKI